MAKGKRIVTSLKSARTHLSRYTRHKLGLSAEEIAVQDKVRVSAVESSIGAIDSFRAANTIEFMNESLVDVVLENADVLKSSLRQSLTANIKDAKGKIVPDHKTRLAAVSKVTELAQAIQPKPTGKGINLNVSQQNANLHAAPPPESGFVGYEERLRNIRRNIDQHNLLPSETGTVIDDDADIEADDEEEVTVSASDPDTAS